jgi:uncharacterized protein (DUF2236 family)
LATIILNPQPGPPMRTIADSLTEVVPSMIPAAIAALGRRVPRGAVAWLMWPSIGLLPPPIRDAYGLPWGFPQQAVSAWLVASWRAWNAVLPASIRQMSQARAADRRVGIDGATWPDRSGPVRLALDQ